MTSVSACDITDFEIDERRAWWRFCWSAPGRLGIGAIIALSSSVYSNDYNQYESADELRHVLSELFLWDHPSIVQLLELSSDVARSRSSLLGEVEVLDNSRAWVRALWVP